MEINNYDQIQILSNNTLVAIDIDETVIYFDNIPPLWWKTRFDYHYTETSDCILADKLTLQEWTTIVLSSEPKTFDISGFKKLLTRVEQTNSKLVLITARFIELKDLTLKQLRYCGINVNDIYFTLNKGHVLKNLSVGIKDVIFVDDLYGNIEDVLSHVPDCTCYMARLDKIDFKYEKIQ